MRCLGLLLVLFFVPGGFSAWGDGGSLTVTAREEAGGEPTISRFELFRSDSPTRTMPVRKTVPAGIGVVLDRNLDLSLPDATYLFRLIRGPEYRIISGTFTLERTSLDTHHVDLPRMIHMLEKGWISGDCGVPPSPASMPLRMAAEDLHLAASLGHVDAKPVPGRDTSDPILHEPVWIREDPFAVDGLILYGMDKGNSDEADTPRNNIKLPIEWLVASDRVEGARVAIENPFAWPLPVWLASERVDGIFILGDWLRLDRKVPSVRDGRGPQGATVSDGKVVGRWAERIYWNMLEAGLRIPPLAGSGDDSGKTPIGYNRLYVAALGQSAASSDPLDVTPVATPDQWWQAAWQGKSVATNGPLLCPKLAGEIPGHVFRGNDQEVLVLQPELNLAVRDPVDYLEVIHNNRVHYSARLDEFAKAGGVIPPIHAKESGWVTIRVVTLFEDHFRAAMQRPLVHRVPRRAAHHRSKRHVLSGLVGRLRGSSQEVAAAGAASACSLRPGGTRFLAASLRAGDPLRTDVARLGKRPGASSRFVLPKRRCVALPRFMPI